MQFQLTQRFYFEAAHTLQRERQADATATSRRVHGHTYHAAVTVTGPHDAATGMVVDLALLRAAIAGLREQLDHHFLDDVPGLSGPATLENLGRFVFDALNANPAWTLVSVDISRPASGDSCLVTAR